MLKIFPGLLQNMQKDKVLSETDKHTKHLEMVTLKKISSEKKKKKKRKKGKKAQRFHKSYGLLYDYS